MLDTNVWLDLLVFRDPGAHALLQALRAGAAIALVSPPMVSELARVLAYPAIALDSAGRDAALRGMASLSASADAAMPHAAFPRCRDPDDQMFVDLALAARVDALLSRDDALLRMAPRLRREGIEVATPAAWCASRSGQISKR